MNQSLINFQFHSINNINRFQNYEICRQQSQCYRLIPPPQLPIFPKFIITNSSFTLTNLHQQTNTVFIIFGLFITLISFCLLLFFLSVKFQLYHKLKQYYHQIQQHANTTDEPSIIPTSYNSLTSLTITTNRSPSFTMINNKSNKAFHQSSNSELYYCSHSLAYYQQKHQITPYYKTYELPSSKIICQNCLFETLHRKQQCLCHNFFVPIK